MRALLLSALCLLPETDGRPVQGMLLPTLQQYVDDRVLPAVAAIPAARKASLDLIAAFIKERKAASTNAEITFICTHNSRRSHLAQLWAATAAWYYGLDHVRTYSGGTEATAFNPRAIAAVERAGFTVTQQEGVGARYAVVFSADHSPAICWSKVYNDPANPQTDFMAVMTCSEADKNCPVVAGALDRVGLPYEDPKTADGTPLEAQRYDERCFQIAVEMFYLMQQAGK